jgi:hypothetical protein
LLPHPLTACSHAARTMHVWMCGSLCACSQLYRELAMNIFTSISPADPGSRTYPCLNKACSAVVHDW